MKKTNILISVFVVIFLIGSGILAYFLATDNNDSNEYTIYGIEVKSDFVINDTLKDGNNEKVKVVIVAGQSNGSGVSSTQYLKDNISNEKSAEYENGYDNVYINYFCDNGSNRSDGFVKTSVNMGCANGYFGPELGLAEILSQEYEKVFIIKYAWGGTCLQTHWLDGSKDEGILYKTFVKFATQSLNYIAAKNYDIDITAMCWMQGESDAFNSVSRTYGDATYNFVGKVRNTLYDFDKSGFAFMDAGISDSSYWPDYKIINQQKQLFAELDPANIYIDTIANGLTYHLEPTASPDFAHYDSLSMIKLGHLFANAIVDFDK